MPPAPTQRSLTRFRSVLVALTVLLASAACVSGGGDGGNGGNGGGPSDFVLRVLVVNNDESVESHVLSYSGGAPLASSEDDEVVGSCAAAVVSYGVVLPFELMIDGVSAIISDELPEPLPPDANLIASIEILADGTVETPDIDDRTEQPAGPGGGISKPSATGICL